MSVSSDTGWSPVPVRLDAERWATWRSERKVLVVVHTVTTGQRLLEIVRLMEGDSRIQVVFTAAPDVFGSGVSEFLHGLRGVAIPWRQAVQTRFDLALASGHEGLHELHAPVMVVPHGVGYNKFIAGGRPGRAVGVRGVYGLSRQWLVRDGAVVPDAIVLSHRDERDRLARHCPEALPTTEVVGDPCVDRIAASRPLRALYRAALGVGPRQRLIVVTSTWGRRSLMGQAPRLVERLVRQLPREECRVATLLHPNAWYAHGEWQIRAWFAELRRAGVLLISQHADWCGPLVAADAVVSDHGSLALYGAAAGAPVLLASFPEADVDPESPMAELATFAPRLTPGRPMRKQLDRAVEQYQPQYAERITARLSSEPGRFAALMRSLLYRKLRLRAPSVRQETQPAPTPSVVGDGHPEARAL